MKVKVYQTNEAISQSRLTQHIQGDDNWAVISAFLEYRTDEENNKWENTLKSEVRKL